MEGGPKLGFLWKPKGSAVVHFYVSQVSFFRKIQRSIPLISMRSQGEIRTYSGFQLPGSPKFDNSNLNLQKQGINAPLFIHNGAVGTIVSLAINICRGSVCVPHLQPQLNLPTSRNSVRQRLQPRLTHLQYRMESYILGSMPATAFLDRYAPDRTSKGLAVESNIFRQVLNVDEYEGQVQLRNFVSAPLAVF